MKKNYVVKALRNPRNALYVVRVTLDLYAGKILFGNTAGFWHNVLGEITTFKVKKTHHRKPDSSFVSELDEKGYAKLGIVFDHDIFENIVKKYNEIIEDDRCSVIRTEYNGKIYSRMIDRIYEQIPEISNLLTEKIIQILNEYYRSNFQVHHILAWRNYHIPPEIVAEKELFASHWHCDGRDASRVTLFINFSDVTEDHGPLHVQSKQRTKELIKMGFGGRHDYKLSNETVEDPRYVIKNVGPAGTAILCNPQLCFHRAGIPGSGKIRDMLEFRFKPSNEPLSKNWIAEITEEGIAK